MSMFRTLWQHRSLALQMTARDIASRYAGTVVGIGWSILTPLLLLGVYTFVFGAVLKGRWRGEASGSMAHFALTLFCGLIVLALFTDVVTRAPGVVVAHANYVKRVVFPLEILPAVLLGTALVNAVISLIVLMVAVAVFDGLTATALWAPIVLAPLALLALGIAWFMASVGTYVRDLSQAVAMLVTLLTFLSPVFYPVEAVPQSMRFLLNLNPLTFIIEQLRQVVIWKEMPDLPGLATYAVVALAVAWAGFMWFQKTRKGFGDVL